MAASSIPSTTDFYPRPPRGGRPRCFFVFAQSFVISIHALREEGDLSASPLAGSV